MYFRMHHFVVEFKKKIRLRRQRGIDPVIKILRTFLPLTLIDCACYLWPLLNRLSSGGVAIRHLLPVLWMTTCLHLIARHKRQEKSVRILKATHQGAVSDRGETSLVMTITLLNKCFKLGTHYRHCAC